MMKKLYDLVEKKLGMDKVAHFFGVMVFAVLISLVFSKLDAGDTSWVYAAEGAFAGIMLAIGKEVFDFFNDRPFDVKDILAGVVGCVVAFLGTGLLL